MRQNAAAKADSYLCAGRLIILRVHEDRVHAICRGDNAIYQLDVHGENASCSCPARGRCSHLIALGKVCASNRVR